jgi:uncharacterized phage protein (TIGR01671 family)
MRSIKFRAWDKVNKRFVCDYNHVLPAHYKGSNYSIEHGGVDYMCVYVPMCDETNTGIADVGGYVDACDLQLWTGLKDKNGKDIYEGDLLKQFDAIFNGLWVIKWNTKKGLFEARYTKWETSHVLSTLLKLKEYEVFGNIYQNPEML